MLTPFGRKLKQVNVILGFLTFCFGIAALVWFFVAEPKDKVEIKSIEINNLLVEFQSDQEPSEPPFSYKVIASLKNPNEKIDATTVYWEIKAQDENNEIIAQKEGTIEIKGNEQKNIEQEISIDKQGKNVSFRVIKIKWEEGEDKK